MRIQIIIFDGIVVNLYFSVLVANVQHFSWRFLTESVQSCLLSLTKAYDTKFNFYITLTAMAAHHQP